MNQARIGAGLLGDARLQAVLDRLHAEADAQRADTSVARPSQDDPEARKAFLSGRFVALERDKAEFCYLVCRALGARHVIEAGTSFGVSTIYLAAAVRENGGGSVIATEYEPAKAAIARKNFAEAGVAHFIDLREGDLRDTLRVVEVPIDFALIDIWASVALPALELIAPRLRPGALVACDNVAAHPEAYADYLSAASDPAQGFVSITVPYDGGLHLSLRTRGLES
jgi:predicted O-methyltransferase YrrM